MREMIPRAELEELLKDFQQDIENEKGVVEVFQGNPVDEALALGNIEGLHYAVECLQEILEKE